MIVFFCMERKHAQALRANVVAFLASSLGSCHLYRTHLFTSVDLEAYDDIYHVPSPVGCLGLSFVARTCLCGASDFLPRPKVSICPTFGGRGPIRLRWGTACSVRYRG